MDFFEYQDQARRRTFLLACIYVATILVLIPLVYLVLLWITRAVRSGYNFFEGHTDLSGTFTPIPHPGWWDVPLFAWVAGVSIVLIIGGTLYQLWSLSRGGHTIMRLLGGIWVDPISSDPKRRQLLNVVEEMAIASGVPIPDVYLIPGRQGINAFTVGLSSDTAVIGVTEPCLKRLDRSELQAVIAHEFSHLLCGDTQLKTMLTGLMHGLVYVGSASNNICLQAVKGNLTMLVVGVFGLIFLAPFTWPLILVLQIGIGTSDTLKRLVSRQREYLADAGALQFTRNPLGITGALKKIGGFSAGSYMRGSPTRHIRHLFFAHPRGGSTVTEGWLAAHPPLTARIRRFEPDFSGDFEYVPYRPKKQAATGSATPGVDPELTTLDGVARMAVAPAMLLHTVGAPQEQHLAMATTLLQSCPDSLEDLTRTLTGAQGVIFGLLLSHEPKTREDQRAYLRKAVDAAVLKATEQADKMRDSLLEKRRLPVAMLAIRSLKQLGKNGYTRFTGHMDRLIEADGQIDLFEFALKRMILRRVGLGCNAVASTTPTRRHGQIASVRDACGDLLSCLAYWGTYELMDQDQAFRIAAAKLDDNTGSLPLRSYKECTLPLLDRALDQLNLCTPSLKKHILQACIDCVAADGKTSVTEAELLQLIADALNCPMPPIGTISR